MNEYNCGVHVIVVLKMCQYIVVGDVCLVSRVEDRMCVYTLLFVLVALSICEIPIYRKLHALHSFLFFFFSSRRRHTRFDCDWSSDVCSSDLTPAGSSRRAACARGCSGGSAPRRTAGRWRRRSG